MPTGPAVYAVCVGDKLFSFRVISVQCGLNQRFFRKPFETCSLLMVKLRLSSECVSKMYSTLLTDITLSAYLIWGHAVAQLVEAQRYKSKGRGFDSRWFHWNFSLT